MEEKTKSFKLTSYDSLNSINDGQFLALSCYSLGGSKKKLNSETIMANAFEWDKKRFSWVLEKFKMYPDNEKLRKGLFAARTNKLIVGAYARKQILKDGWILTASGIEKCKSLEYLINIKSSKITLSAKDKKLISNFKKNEFYKKIDSDQFSIYLLAEMLDVSSSNLDLLRSKVQKIQQMAILDEDRDLEEVIKNIKSKEIFAKIFNDEIYLNQHKVKSRSKKRIL